MLDGKPKTLYMQTVASLKEATKGNLKKTLKGKDQIIFIQRIIHPSANSWNFRFVLVCILHKSGEDLHNKSAIF